MSEQPKGRMTRARNKSRQAEPEAHAARVIREVQAAGVTKPWEIAACLTALHVRPLSSGEWTAAEVTSVLKRAGSRQ